MKSQRNIKPHLKKLVKLQIAVIYYRLKRESFFSFHSSFFGPLCSGYFFCIACKKEIEENEEIAKEVEEIAQKVADEAEERQKEEDEECWATSQTTA